MASPFGTIQDGLDAAMAGDTVHVGPGEYGAVSTALVDRESGHVAQNILLEATAIGLAAVPVGGFEPEPVARLLGLPDGHDVRYLIPVG